MAATTSSAKLRFAISYGLGGGPVHAKEFVHRLKSFGYQPATIQSADIIIAHSGGCWLIPVDARPKLVIYVGMPLAQEQPRQTWQAAKGAMVKYGNLKHTVKTTVWNSYYSIRQPRRNLGMIKMAKTAQPVIFPGCPTVFVANQHDPWTKSKNMQNYLRDFDWAFVSMPGAHDDIWEHSKRYTSLTRHYARLLG